MADTISIKDANGVVVDVSVDDITSLNGVPVTGPHAQRFKLVFGPDGSATDASSADPLPVTDSAAAAALETIRAAVDGLEGYTDQLESLLTTLGSNTDGLEGLLTALGTNTDQIESLLTTLGGYTDTLEALLAPSTPSNIPGASGAITGVTGVLMGVSARETSGTATAFFRLRAGSATGTVLATVTLAANESIRDWYGPSGIQATGGVYYELVSGAVAGGVQTR